ncbi:MAG: hypothetical protein KBC56_05985 [Flavobacterium sp.]|nr:hypothetical protein [Flavobacterium sp.]
MKLFKKLSIALILLLASNSVFSQTTFHRLFNPVSGKHFYTTNSSGVEYSQYPVYEGVLGTIPGGGDNVDPIFVLINLSTGDRIMTKNIAERNFLILNGYTYQGIMGYLGQIPSPYAIKSIHRYYSSTRKEHFYTNNYNELGSGKYGYVYEGVAFFLAVS